MAMSNTEKCRRWRQKDPKRARAAEARKKAKNPTAYRARMCRAQWKFRGTPSPTRPEPAQCELCGKPEITVRGGTVCHLMLDHDHATGLFRGWLCNACNLGLGKLGDTIEALERAIAYLKRAYECQPSQPSPSTTSSQKSAF